MTNPSKIAVLEVDPKFVLEIAYGIREPADVASDYGYTQEEWEKLKAYPPFIKIVETRKAELVATGVTFRMKTAMMAEDLLPDIYNDAKAQGANFHTKLAALTFLAKAGGIDSPKKDEEQAGNQFNISINLGGGNVVKISGNQGNNSQKVVENEALRVLADISEAGSVPHGAMDLNIDGVVTDESLDFEDELSYDSTHYFLDNYTPRPLPE